MKRSPFPRLTRSSTPRGSRARSWLEVAALGGGLIVLSAAVLGTQTPKVTVAPLETSPVVEAPLMVTVQDPVSIPDPVIELEDETIEAKTPMLALEHEEAETNFEELAAEQMKSGELEAAFTSMRKQLYSSSPTAALLLKVARVGREIGQLALAEEALLDAGNLEPDNADIHTELARIYMETNDFESARFSARQAIRLDPESAAAWNLAGRAAMGENEFQRAELAYRRAVALDPSDPMLHNNLGLLYIFMKRSKDAVDSLETSVELYGDAVPHYVLNNLGLAYELNAQLEDARDSFEQALLVDPMYARAQVNMKRIEDTMLERESRRVVAEVPEAAPPESGEDSMVPEDRFVEEPETSSVEDEPAGDSDEPDFIETSEDEVID